MTHLTQPIMSPRRQDGLLDAGLVTDTILFTNTSKAIHPCGGSLRRGWCDGGSVVVVVVADDNVLYGRADGNRVGAVSVSLAAV